MIPNSRTEIRRLLGPLWRCVASFIPAGFALVAPASALNAAPTQDVNSDQPSDILWRNDTTGQVVIWLMNGTGVIGGGLLGSVANPWGIVGQRSFSGFTFYNILWRNSTTGQVVIWEF